MSNVTENPKGKLSVKEAARQICHALEIPTEHIDLIVAQIPIGQIGYENNNIIYFLDYPLNLHRDGEEYYVDLVEFSSILEKIKSGGNFRCLS